MTERAWNVAIRAAKAEKLEIAVYDVIGKDWLFGDGFGAQDFLAKLRSAPQAKEIDLRVNSVGGIVDDAKAMVNLLAERAASGVNITAYVDGLAASAASFLLTAAHRVVMPSNAFLMLHEVRGGVRGRAQDLESAALVFRKNNEQLAEAYAAASVRRGKKKSADDYLAQMARGDFYLTAREAVDWGLADVVAEPLKVAASLADIELMPENAPEALRAAPYWASAVAVATTDEPPAPPAITQPAASTENNAGNAGEENSMKRILKLLGLSDTATEDEAVAELEKLQAKATASVTVSGVQLLGVATEGEATAKIQELQRGALQVLGATGKASVPEAMGVVLEWKTKADTADGLTKQVATLTETARVAKRDAAIEKLSREGSLPPARHEWARAQFQTAEAVETFCEGMPKGFFNTVNEPTSPEAALTLTEEEKLVCKNLGMTEAQYLEEKKLLRKAG